MRRAPARAVDRPPKLTADQEAGLIAAIESIQQGKGVPVEQVKARMRAMLKARRAKIKRK